MTSVFKRQRKRRRISVFAPWAIIEEISPESGDANLATSCIAYDALVSCGYLEAELSNPERAAYCRKAAKKLKASIETYFGANVEGFDTNS